MRSSSVQVWAGIQSWSPDVTSRGLQGPVGGMACTEGDRGPVQ